MPYASEILVAVKVNCQHCGRTVWHLLALMFFPHRNWLNVKRPACWMLQFKMIQTWRCLQKKWFAVVAKSRLGEVRIKKPTKPNSFHTSGSPRADPYPNFEPCPYVIHHIIHYNAVILCYILYIVLLHLSGLFFSCRLLLLLLLNYGRMVKWFCFHRWGRGIWFQKPLVWILRLLSRPGDYESKPGAMFQSQGSIGSLWSGCGRTGHDWTWFHDHFSFFSRTSASVNQL
jgi:hypothetical protein